MDSYADSHWWLCKCVETPRLLSKQTLTYIQGAPCERHACAAASRRHGDPASLPTAGKTEFVKSELELMRKNTDPYPTHRPANQETGLPWEQRQKQSSGAVMNRRVRTQTAKDRRRTHTHASYGRVRQGVGLRLAGVCMYVGGEGVGFLQPAIGFHSAQPAHHVCICDVCVCVCVCAPSGSDSRLAIRQRMQRQIRV